MQMPPDEQAHGPLRGTIAMGTYDIHESPCVDNFFPTMFCPAYLVPP